MAPHFHLLQVKEQIQETDECIVVSFHIPEALQTVFAFTHGQNITIKAIADDQELRRSYSICSSPLDNELKIAIKKVAGGRFSTAAVQLLQKGNWVEVLPPAGKFFTPLHAGNKKNYVAFAAGSGITPLLSIIKTTLATEPDSRFTLIYGNKNRASIIFKEELEALKNIYINRFAVHHILSREKTDTDLNNGRIDAEKCAVIFKYLLDLKSSDEFFICGPREMILSVQQFLENNRVEKERVHFELFSVPGVGSTAPVHQTQIKETTAAIENKMSQVTIKLDGISFDFILPYNGDAILDAALATGADLPYACRGGVCATCRAKLLSGEVSMDTNYALEPSEIENGYILTCQSHPRSEKVFIDFDQR
ncbi:MAG: phenylacetate-CoA oxygenase/reductase subunit PaaK [Chitinophagaceae bacterium]